MYLLTHIQVYFTVLKFKGQEDTGTKTVGQINVELRYGENLVQKYDAEIY